jgi:hypothetical protein
MGYCGIPHSRGSGKTAPRGGKMCRTIGRVTISVTLTLLANLFGCGGGHAQDNGPTDTDLRAGYCLGLLNALPDPCKIPTAGFPALTYTVKQWCQKQQDAITRLSAYLEARGYQHGPKEPTGVLVAETRGSTDVRDCMADTTAEDRACLLKCTDLNTAEACMAACPTPEACKRQERCRDLSFLPF